MRNCEHFRARIHLPYFFALWSLRMLLLSILTAISIGAGAETGGAITGQVVDEDGAAVHNAGVQLFVPSADPLAKAGRETRTSLTGEFQFSPLEVGTYTIVVKADHFADYRSAITVSPNSAQRLEVRLETANPEKLVVVNVKEKRNMVPIRSSGSQRDLSHDDITSLPQGDDISLPRLLATTTPGIVQGPFGQMFVRGNHGNIQYQIDGVQLPDSGSGTFGDAFSPRNIERMEVITGGVPAEYGERLAAVLNIVTKSGPEVPGGNAEINYGSYATISPHLVYGGSDESGKFHYFTSINYNQSDRGLDTPEPSSYAKQNVGGEQAIHDKTRSDEEFVRLDYLPDNNNKFTLTAFNSTRYFQIPIFPSVFRPTDAYFQPGYTDAFGNQGSSGNNGSPTTTFSYAPPGTDDSQTERSTFIQGVWKKTISDRAFLQVAPYVKLSSLVVTNDPKNDLATAQGGSLPLNGTGAGVNATSFALNRSTNNYGLKTDYTARSDDKNLWKAGFQIQRSDSTTKSLFIQTELDQAPFTDSGADHGNLGAVYIQDSFTATHELTLNLGLRYTGTTFESGGTSTSDGLLQPRLGVEYLVQPETKLHAFYGKLYMPAPFEDLRKAFSLGAGEQNYDLKAEKDDYYELGVSHQLGERSVIALNVYYKSATNMLDDAQLFNTSVAQPYNFAKGYADGVELSILGELAPNWNAFANYSYEIAKGEGIAGGLFAFQSLPGNDYHYLDHVQIHTANSGLTYAKDQWWTTLQGLYGSGLRTGADNASSLPSHLTFDYTVGYRLKAENWWNGTKMSLDILNLLDDAYPITIANGFNGSHYSAGREFFVRLTKDF